MSGFSPFGVAFYIALVLSFYPSGLLQASRYFVDVSGGVGLQPYSPALGMTAGASVADYDNDGDIDFFVPNEAGVADQLYENRGNGQFLEIAVLAGVDSTRHNRAALFFDVDNDDLLELMVLGDCFTNCSFCPDPDCQDPVWGAKQIDLAADHGVTAFMFDWYWYSGVKLFHNALEKGFLQAPNNERLKFFLMWANHEWWDFPAVNNTPGMGQKTWLWVHHTLDELASATRYCCENYFSKSNYLKIDGNPVFCWYQPYYLKEKMEAESPGTGPLDHMNAEARKCGFDGIYFIANIGCLGGNPYSVRWDLIPRLKNDGYEAVFPYNICSAPSRPTLPPDRPVHDYAEIMEAHEHVWAQCEGKGLPFNPNVSMGLDCSPRWHPSVALPVDVDNYLPFVDNCTPDRYGTMCGKALDHIDQHGSDSKILFLNAWNEWTEGMYLLPEKRYGTGYLEALKNAVDKRAK